MRLAYITQPLKSTNPHRGQITRLCGETTPPLRGTPPQEGNYQSTLTLFPSFGGVPPAGGGVVLYPIAQLENKFKYLAFSLLTMPVYVC